MAASPAATVKIKSEKIWPIESFKKAEKAIRFILILNKINSKDIKIIVDAHANTFRAAKHIFD